MILKLNTYLSNNFPRVLTLLQNITCMEWIITLGVAYIIFIVLLGVSYFY
jgi:hypothetical protein